MVFDFNGSAIFFGCVTEGFTEFGLKPFIPAFGGGDGASFSGRFLGRKRLIHHGLGGVGSLGLIFSFVGDFWGYLGWVGGL
jgi:hypothetical protein